ncbi:MAG: hypothetical protein COT15_01325, partial [Candidatus Diapherotrites archaeon CG08_land_8_20_14_0_20_34_12]
PFTWQPFSQPVLSAAWREYPGSVVTDAKGLQRLTDVAMEYVARKAVRLANLKHGEFTRGRKEEQARETLEGTKHTVRTMLSKRLVGIVNKAERDERTGLYNKEAFEQRARAHLRERGNFAFIYIDANNLKKRNDLLGHTEGDKLIDATAETVASLASKYNALVGRVGGDEFAIIFPVSHILKNARAHTATFMQEVEEEFGRKWELKKPVKPRLGSIAVGCSIKGEFQTLEDPYHKIFKKAEQRMYTDKKRKKAGRR